MSKEIQKALSFYPKLKDTAIEFIFKKNIRNSTMLAQPSWSSFFKPKANREYRILISEKIQISGKEFETKEIPSDVITGWIGHELGHIMDYQNRSTLNLIYFGLKYIISDSFLRNAERAADTFAVKNGMKDYILATKNFILNEANIDEKYKMKIKKYYLSPEEILQIVNDMEIDSN